jgi:hypothetical protein
MQRSLRPRTPMLAIPADQREDYARRVAQARVV